MPGASDEVHVCVQVVWMVCLKGCMCLFTCGVGCWCVV